jgi:hypothetical protein
LESINPIETRITGTHQPLGLDEVIIKTQIPALDIAPRSGSRRRGDRVCRLEERKKKLKALKTL